MSQDHELGPEIRGRLTLNEAGLLPVVAQDATTGEVLMVAWMNEEALATTLATRQAVYWSRSRGELWRKGANSGNVQRVTAARLDCDGDTVLLTVEQTGPACHTGAQSCFDDGELPLGAGER